MGRADYGTSRREGQVRLTTHAEVLVEGLGAASIRLDKQDGATVRAGRPKGLAFSAEWDA